MLIEGYPVGWAIDTRKPEPVLAYLIDIPGIAMQGRTMKEAVRKLQVFAPTVLSRYLKEGTQLPQPSREPNLLIASVQMQWHEGLPTHQTDVENADIQLAYA